MSGFDLFMVHRYLVLGAAGHVALMVTDPEYRGKSLLASARRVMELREALGLPFQPSAMERAALPRQQAVRIEGRMNGDGRLMFLLSDPGRPSKVYERVMAERRERAPQNDSGGPQSDVVTDW